MIDIAAFLGSSQRFEMVRGSCLEVLRLTPPMSIDAFITDPPYGIELQLGTATRRQRIVGDGKLEARKLWADWVPLAFRAAKENTAHAVFGTWKSAWMHEILSSHFAVKGCIAWDKRMIGLGYYLRPRWEMIYLCHKGKPPRPDHAPADVWNFLRERRPQHPCQKPVPLMRELAALLTRREKQSAIHFRASPPRAWARCWKVGDFSASRSTGDSAEWALRAETGTATTQRLGASRRSAGTQAGTPRRDAARGMRPQFLKAGMR